MNFIYLVWEKNCIVFLQQFPLFILLMKIFSSLIILVILGGFWLYFFNKKQGVRAIIYIVLSLFIMTLLKNIFHLPRPFWVFPEIIGFGSHRDFGFPSGHLMISSLVLYLSFFALKKRRLKILLSLLFLFIMALSRVSLGAHFIYQTVCGFLFGLIIMSLLIILEKKYLPIFRGKSFKEKTIFLWMLFFTIGMITIFLYKRFALYYNIPLEWSITAKAYTHNKELIGVSLISIAKIYTLMIITSFSLLYEDQLFNFKILPFHKTLKNPQFLLMISILCLFPICLYLFKSLFLFLVLSPILFIIGVPLLFNKIKIVEIDFKKSHIE